MPTQKHRQPDTTNNTQTFAGVWNTSTGKVPAGAEPGGKAGGVVVPAGTKPAGSGQCGSSLLYSWFG